MRLAGIRLLAAILSAFVALACGRSSSESTTGSRSGTERDPQETCALLTAEDIQSVLGTTPGAPRFEKPQCIWASADGSQDHLVQLIVTSAYYRSYDDIAKAYRETMDGADPAKAMHPIEGAGLFAVGYSEMPMVQIYTGSSMVQVATFGNEELHALELAKKVVGRLE